LMQLISLEDFTVLINYLFIVSWASTTWIWYQGICTIVGTQCNMPYSIYLSNVCDSYRLQGSMLPGDVLMVTAFISYVGCFTKQFRLDLLNKMWLPNLRNLEVRKYKFYVVRVGIEVII
jgi:hypothetical protein